MADYGLIGYPLSHSFSASFFKEKFKHLDLSLSYEAFPIPSIDSFPSLLKTQKTLKGLNVTLPYKKDIINSLDFIHKEALAIGAVNCIKIERQQCFGFNTDAWGFQQSLKSLLKPQHNQAIIFGDGGAAQAVKYALHSLQIPYQVVSRKGAFTFEQVNAQHIESHLILIHTTPLGMYPHIHTYPDIPYEAITANHLVVDLVYNPQQSLLLQKAALQGAQCLNGMPMLIAQAEKSWEIWQNELPLSEMLAVGSI